MPTRDALIFFPWFGVNALLATASWRAAGRLFPGEGARSRLFHALTLGWACLTLVLTALGATGLLRPGLALAAVGLVAAAGLLWGSSGRPVATACDPTQAPDRRVRVLWTALAALWLGHVVTRTAIEFTSEFDALMYHIPMIDYWLQAGSLYAPDGTHWANPGGNELIGLWMVAPFSGDFLVRLTNIPATFLLALAAAELGSILGLRRPLDNLAGFAVAANFIVIAQLVDSGNDTAVAALFLAGLCYSLRFRRSHRAADLLLCSACTGLLAGIKYYALGYAAILWLSLVLPEIRRGRLAHALRAGGIGLLVSLLFGGYWYARNMVVSGTPFFPMGLSSSSDLLAQTYPDAGRTSFLGNGRPEVPALALRAVWQIGGACHTAAILALPIVLPWLLSSSRPGHRSLAALIAATAAVLAITPFALEDSPGTLNHLRWAYTPFRYGLCFLSLSVIALALALQALADRLRAPELQRGFAKAWPALLLGTAAASQILFLDGRHPIDWAFCAPLVLNAALLAALLPSRILGRPRPVIAVAGVIAVMVAGAFAIDRLSKTWDDQFHRSYDRLYGTRIFSTLRPYAESEPRLCLLDYRCHPFFGSRRQFRVCQPLQVPSSDVLADYLRQHDVELVVIRSGDSSGAAGWDAYTRPEDWRLALERDATLLHRDAIFALYRMKPSSRTTTATASDPISTGHPRRSAADRARPDRG